MIAWAREGETSATSRPRRASRRKLQTRLTTTRGLERRMCESFLGSWARDSNVQRLGLTRQLVAASAVAEGQFPMQSGSFTVGAVRLHGLVRIAAGVVAIIAIGAAHAQQPGTLDSSFGGDG